MGRKAARKSCEVLEEANEIGAGKWGSGEEGPHRCMASLDLLFFANRSFLRPPAIRSPRFPWRRAFQSHVALLGCLWPLGFLTRTSPMEPLYSMNGALHSALAQPILNVRFSDPPQVSYNMRTGSLSQVLNTELEQGGASLQVDSAQQSAAPEDRHLTCRHVIPSKEGRDCLPAVSPQEDEMQ